MPRRLLSLALLLCLTAAGCRLVSRTPTATPLTFAFWALDPGEVALTHQLVDEYERQSGVHVEVLEIPHGYYEKLSTMFAGGTPPDLMVVNYGRMTDLARRGLLADLRPLVSQRADLGLDGLVAPARAAFATPAGLPVEWNPANLLLYDPETLAEAGVRPGSGWSWEEFAAACRTLKRTLPRNQRAAAICLYPYATYSWLRQGGGEVVDAAGQIVLDSAQNVRTLEFLQRLEREGLTTALDPSEDRSLEEFRARKVAMVFVTPYSLAVLRKSQSDRPWAVMAPLHDRARATGCLASAIVMSRDCRNPDAASDFLGYYVTTASQRRTAGGYCASAWGEGAAAELEAGFGPDVAKLLQWQAGQAHVFPAVPGLSYELVSGELRLALERVFSGKVEPGTALEQAAAKLGAAQRRQQ